MRSFGPMTILATVLIMSATGFFAGGCTSNRYFESVLDSPEHHVSNGFKLTRKGLFDDARREFELSLALDPENSAAYRGMGLVYAMQGQFALARQALGHAGDYARDKESKALALAGFMNLYTLEKDQGWLGEAEKRFHQAISIMKDLPDPYYYMGVAYKDEYRFSESKALFRRVLEINKTLLDEAAMQIETLQKIETVMPDSALTRRIALLDSVTRADMAALLVRELRLDRIYQKKQRKELPRPLPLDIKNHPYKREIETVLELGIEGLTPLYNGDSHLTDYVTRAGYAMMISDIMATAEDDPSLATRYIRQKSPFLDVSNDIPAFNAIMVCTRTGVIKEIGDGMFNPTGKVSGVDALMAIKKLKELLDIPR